MPSLRERLQSVMDGPNHSELYVRVEQTELSNAIAVLAAAEAWAQAMWAKRLQHENAGQQLRDADEAMLALFPPPDAKETP